MARGLGWMAGLAVLALAIGCLVPRHPAGMPDRASAGRHRIIVLSSAIHTDIALPAEPEVRRRFGFLEGAGLPLRRADVAHVVVGWGGRSFYVETPTWSALRFGPVVRSFTRDASVLHVELAGAIEGSAPGRRAFDLDDAAFEALLRSIEAGFTRDASGRPVLVEGAGYGAFDRFFEAEGGFNALLGCNVWTGRTLREAGLATGLWTPLPASLFWSLDLHNSSVDDLSGAALFVGSPG